MWQRQTDRGERERERERQTDRQTDTDRDRDRPVGVSECVESVFTAVETRRYHCNLHTDTHRHSLAVSISASWVIYTDS